MTAPADDAVTFTTTLVFNGSDRKWRKPSFSKRAHPILAKHRLFDATIEQWGREPIGPIVVSVNSHYVFCRKTRLPEDWEVGLPVTVTLRPRVEDGPGSATS